MEVTVEQLERWDREHVWHPFTPMEQYASERPLIIESAEGFHLIDIQGRRYIDGVSSLWCNVHGHHVPELDAAIRDQLDRVAHSTLLGLANVPSIRLARKLVEIAPAGLEHVFFSDNGSTAVEVALKMAFQYWRQRPDARPRKTKFLTFTNAYHGDTVGSTSLGGIAHFHAIFGPLLFSTIQAPGPIDDIDAAVDLVRKHKDELAAVVVEPLVQGASGILVAPDGFLRRLREVTKQSDVLLIADEVAVGFGRTGTMFACEQEQVTPDFLCLAKGLTGGYLPMAATLTTAEVYSAFLGPPHAGRTFYHGHTYTGNPLAAAVALANLELFETNQLLAALPKKIELLSRWLERMAALPGVGAVRHKGLMAGVELVRDKATREPYPAALQVGREVCLQARQRGALLRPLGNVVVLMPPLAIDLPLLNQLCEITYDCISSARTS
jgi:adenosylmethionine-8-amino-7-oxononanoate aminotransferase